LGWNKCHKPEPSQMQANNYVIDMLSSSSWTHLVNRCKNVEEFPSVNKLKRVKCNPYHKYHNKITMHFGFFKTKGRKNNRTYFFFPNTSESVPTYFWFKQQSNWGLQAWLECLNKFYLAKTKNTYAGLAALSKKMTKAMPWWITSS